jgi:sugar/nucleoside kinase (ribokinase family)
VQILTRGVVAEIEELLAPYSADFELQVQPAPCTTSLETSGKGPTRAQRVLAWAGPIELSRRLDTTLLHLAPVARETVESWSGRADFVGLTPQGLLRFWSEESPRIVLRTPQPSPLFERCQAIVLSQAELPSFTPLLAQPNGGEAASATGRRPILAVTDEAAPTELRLPRGEVVRLAVPPVPEIRDETGAGDVFAAAFFIALADGEEPRRAAAFANAAGAVRVAGLGPEAIGDRAAIAARQAAIA